MRNQRLFRAQPKTRAATTPHIPQSIPQIPNLQRLIGNAATLRLLNQSIQRQEDYYGMLVDELPTSDPDAPPPAIPKVDLRPWDHGQAFQIDWDRQHEEIAGLQGDQTMREAFEIHLFDQLAERLPDVFTECTTHAEAERLIQEKILEADAAGNPEEAERLQREWNISLQFAVVKTLNVEESARYKRTGKPTYCNIYAYDVISALGGYLPRVWWNDDVIDRIRQGENVPAIYPPNKNSPGTIHEVNANELTRWFAEFGGEFGWEKAANMTEAQDAANNGELAIIVAANKNPDASGHITVVMPETEDVTAKRDEQGNVIVPTQSEAGANNREHAVGNEWWKKDDLMNGAAYIFRGERNSQLLSPEECIPDGVIGEIPGMKYD
ncbi:MAG TPA: hypothetical protein VK003_19170 [Oceanobacillus sp.]|nr:hypothetical protein [Oceanobacillus sp.]